MQESKNVMKCFFTGTGTRGKDLIGNELRQDPGPYYNGSFVFSANPAGSVSRLALLLIYEGAMMQIYNRSGTFVKT